MATEYLLRLRDVSARSGLSRSEIYKQMKAGSFPRSVPLGPRSVAWPASDVDRWVSAHIKQARAAQATQLPPGPGPDLAA